MVKDKDNKNMWCTTCGRDSETEICHLCAAIFATYDSFNYKIVERVHDEIILEKINDDDEEKEA